jgi:2-polyprenyl-3-methyl-5-hydroxy-6-metoxy-1,4-benzoquinol methylase
MFLGCGIISEFVWRSFVTPIVERVFRSIDSRNPVHGKRLAAHLTNLDPAFESELCVVMDRYLRTLGPDSGGVDFLVDCYLRLLDDVFSERLEFERTGHYSSTSFDEVNARVYNNPQVMSYYMHGLFLSQLLWHQHCRVYEFFTAIARRYAPQTKHYLEVGGGHGLYLRAFCAAAGPEMKVDVVDISATSLKLCEAMADRPSARFIHGDVHEHQGPASGYDFITMGEVLEHVEDPLSLLCKLHQLCAPGGHVLVTTPTNAPAIDHIYLFHDVPHIVDIITRAGFQVVDQIAVVTEEAPLHRKPVDVKIATLYGALLSPVRN